MRYRILGSLDVWDGQAWTRVSAAKWRSLLAFLLIHADRLVSADSLITELWGERVPPSAAKSLQVYVHRLRRALGPSADRLHSGPGGYELVTEPGDVDADRFSRLADAGRAALAEQRPDAAIEALTEALALWRGRALAGVPTTPAVLAEADRLDERRLVAWEDLSRAKLAIGRHAELAADLRPLLAEQPLREPLWVMLMTALHRSGRRSDALHAYATARRALADELGVEPGGELRRLHRSILDDADPADGGPSLTGPSLTGPSLTGSVLAGPVLTGPGGPVPAVPAGGATSVHVTAAGTATDPLATAASPADPGTASSPAAAPAAATPCAPPAAPPAAPCHLPTAVPDFTGRRAQVDKVLSLLGGPGARAAGAADTDTDAVAAEAGSAPGHDGTGAPTTRTVAVTGKAGVGKSAFAIHVAHLLRPAFPHGQLYADLRAGGGRPAEPAEVLASLLRELGLTGAQIPDSTEERARRYRAELAERRMLVVLDNAASERQIRPLLPGAGGSAVLVSSRSALAGIEGAHRVGLDVLPDGEALDLLARASGDDRTRRDPTSAHRIIGLCGNLPLALRILGARLATRPHLSASRLAAALVDERHRLDELVAGDLEVRASVSLSYEALDARDRRAFRLLATVAAPTVPGWACGVLLDCPQGAGDRVVDTLVDHHLLEIDSVDATGEPRFRLHDLVRLYGCEQADAQEPADERRAALVRLCAAYLDLVRRADAELDAGFLGPLPDPSPAPVWRPPAALVARLRAAPSTWLDAERTTVCALVRQAAALGEPGMAWRLAAALAQYFEIGGHFDDWRHTHRIALTAAGAAGDRLGEAVMHRNLGELGTVQDRYAEAGASFEQALQKCAEHRGENPFPAADAAGHADAAGVLEAVTGIGLGVLLRLRGRYGEAAACLRRGVTGSRTAGNTRAEVYARSALASLHLERGEPDTALRELRHALEVFRRAPHRNSEYAVHRSLGLAELAAGRLQQAAQRMELAERMSLAQGDQVGAVHAQQWLGHIVDVSGDALRAKRMLEECLAAYRRFGERFGEALTLRALADLHLNAGRFALALEAVRASLAIWRQLGTPYWTSRTLDLLAQVHTAISGADSAVAARARAEARALRGALGLPGTLCPVTVAGRQLGGHLSLPDAVAGRHRHPAHTAPSRPAGAPLSHHPG